MTLGDIHIITTLYLMVVTCDNKNFKLPHSNFRKISFFLLFGENFSFQKNFLRKLSRENFHFLCEIFFSVSVFSLVYILYISKTVKQKLFGANFCGFSVLALHFSNQQERSFTVKGDILTALMADIGYHFISGI